MFSDRMIFEPVMKIKESFYRCDSKFYLDNILGMYQEHETHGIIYTDGKICINYEYKYGNFRKISSKTIHLQNQFKNGGQSSNRLARNRDIQREQYITGIAEKIVSIFYDKNTNKPNVKSIIFCGPAQFKIEVSEHKLISSFFDSIHLDIINMGLMDEKLIEMTINNLTDPVEQAIIDEINLMISRADNRLVFGNDIIPCIESCELKTLYVHKDKTMEEFKTDYGLEIIKISSHMITTYGGMIGIKFY